MNTSSGVSPIITVVSADHQQPPRPPQQIAADFKFRWLDFVAQDGNLTAVQLRVLMALFSVADVNGHRIFPRHETLAGKLNLHIKTVQRNLRQLEALEWIVRLRKGAGRGGTGSAYHLRIPDRHLLPATR